MATSFRVTLFYAVIAVLACLALPGCYVKVNAYQSTSGGTTATTTSSQVAGSARFSGGRASFSSGQTIPAGAPGGSVRLSGSSAGVAVVGLALADLVNYIVGPAQPKPLAPGTRIADTCSCYEKTGE